MRGPSDIGRNLVGGAVAGGFLVDRALFSGSINSLAWAILFAGLSLLILVTGRATTTTARLALAGAVFFGAMLAVRTEPRLVAFNYLAVVTLWFIVTVFGRPDPEAPDRRLFHYRPSQSVADAGRVVSNGFSSISEGITELSARSTERNEREPIDRSKRGSILRGLLIAGPIVTALWLLLSSADVVFQSLFQVDLSGLSPAGRHIIPVIFGVGAVGLALFVTGLGGAPATSYRTPRLGATETGIVLGSINVLYSLFAISQAVALSGAGERIIADSGMTFKEYARHGFFQLLWVAGLTLVILIVAHTITAGSEASERRILRLLSYVTVGLTLVLVGVAFRRLGLYIADNGLTPLRFYSSVFSVWVGVAFGIVGIWVARKSVASAWLMPALVISGLLVLAGLDLANPEAIIASVNLDRDQGSLLFHMDKQTGDGNTVLASNLHRLSPDLASEVEARLCIGFQPENEDGFWGWNLGRSTERQALSELCG